MKFGEQLKSRLNNEWRFYYMDYDGLKKLLKERTSSGTYFAETDEAIFVQALEKEIEKVLNSWYDDDNNSNLLFLLLI